MGELLDALNAADAGADAPTKSAIDQAGDLFRAASQGGQRGDRCRPRARHALGQDQSMDAANASAGACGRFLDRGDDSAASAPIGPAGGNDGLSLYPR
jgi:hypothetical protein